MLDVTYINSVSQVSPRITTPLSPRIMENILSRDKDLNVIYDNSYLVSRLFYAECIKQGIPVSRPEDSKEIYDLFFPNLIDSIKTEYVLSTIGSSGDLYFVTHLLNAGKKVIIGGPLTKIYNCQQLRKMLSNYTDKLNNLIIVRPYLGLTTSIYKIILDWKDLEDDVEFIHTNIFETNNDYLLNYIDKLNSINKISGVQTLLNTRCSWGKCTFCTYQNQFKEDFTKSMDIDNYIKSTIQLCKKYNARIVDIADPIILFTKNNIRILKAFKEAGLFIIGFSNVTFMLNEKYLNNIMKYIGMVRIGVETFDDFGLKQLDKGYTYNDILKLISLLVKYKKEYNMTCGILLHLMLNLPSYDKESIIVNYNNIVKASLELYDANIPLHLRTGDLFVSPYVSLIENNEFIKSDQKSGDTLFHTYKRYDYKGNELPVDEDIVHPDIYKFVTNQLKNQPKFYNYTFDEYKKKYNIKDY